VDLTLGFIKVQVDIDLYMEVVVLVLLYIGGWVLLIYRLYYPYIYRV
jgi:hypothetical protein